MKVLTKDQFYSIPLRLTGAFTPIQLKLEELEVGTALMIEPEDWKVKGQLSSYVNSRYRVGKSSKRFQCRALPNKSGWAILRLA